MKKHILWKVSIFFTVLCIGVACAVHTLFERQERAPLSCDSPDFSFGRIPFTDNAFVGTHTFKIRNNTRQSIRIKEILSTCPCVKIVNGFEVIPAKEAASLDVRMELSIGDWQERRGIISITPGDKEIPKLNLSLHGHSGFSTFLENQGTLDFGVVFRNDYAKKPRDLLLYASNATAVKNKISKIVTENTGNVSVRKLPETNETMRDSVGQFVLQKNPLCFSLDIKPDSKLGGRMEKIVLFLNTGEKQTITVTYEVREKPVFDTVRFYLINLKSGEERVFSVLYNRNAGGTPRIFHIEGSGYPFHPLKSRKNPQQAPTRRGRRHESVSADLRWCRLCHRRPPHQKRRRFVRRSSVRPARFRAIASKPPRGGAPTSR
jgi:hypothetical protein